MDSANAAEFHSGYRLKSTLKVPIHFTPLWGVSDKIRSTEGTDPMFFM